MAYVTTSTDLSDIACAIYAADLIGDLLAEIGRLTDGALTERELADVTGNLDEEGRALVRQLAAAIDEEGAHG